MSKDPAFLFYTSDFLTGTMFMSNEEIGQYIKTLCILHQHKGKLPQEKIEIAVGKLSVSVLEKLSIDDGLLCSKRLEEEIEKRKNFCESRRKNIQKRYNKTTSEATSETTSVKHMILHMENENENENEDVNVIEDRDIKDKIRYAENVNMTQIEYDTLIRKFGKFHTEKSIFVLDNYKGSKGKKYKSDYRAILSWVIVKVQKDFPISKHKTGDKEEKFNREGIAKINNLIRGTIC